MPSTRKRAGRGSQRQRVYPHRETILKMLAEGATQSFIQEALGLEDIPKTSFHHLLQRIRQDHAEMRLAAIVYPRTSFVSAAPSAPHQEIRQSPTDDLKTSTAPRLSEPDDPEPQTAQAPSDVQHEFPKQPRKPRRGLVPHPDHEIPKPREKRKSAFLTDIHKPDPEDLY